MEERERGTAAVDADEGDRKAVGGDDDEGPARLVRPEPVGLHAPAFGTEDLTAVHLPGPACASRLGAGCGEEAPPVLLDALPLVVRQQTQVERGVRPFAHPADPRREANLVRARGLLPADQVSQ